MKWKFWGISLTISHLQVSLTGFPFLRNLDPSIRKLTIQSKGWFSLVVCSFPLLFDAKIVKIESIYNRFCVCVRLEQCFLTSVLWNFFMCAANQIFEYQIKCVKTVLIPRFWSSLLYTSECHQFFWYMLSVPPTKKGWEPLSYRVFYSRPCTRRLRNTKSI